MTTPTLRVQDNHRRVEATEFANAAHHCGRGVGARGGASALAQRAITGLLAALWFLAAAGPAQGSWAWMSEGTYGPSQTIIIEVGMLNFVPGTWLGECPPGECPDGGWCDDYFGFYVSARAYIVPNGSVDPNGPHVPLDPLAAGPYHVIIQETSTSGFFGEVIGLTAPAGPIVDGTYDLIFDECEDGWFSPNHDEIVATFSVEGAGYVPGTHVNPALFDFKPRAGELEERYEYHWEVVKSLQTGLSALSALQFLAGVLTTGWFPEVLNFAVDQAGISWKGFIGTIQDFIVSGLKNQFEYAKEHWKKVKEDPPDPDFTVEVALGPVEAFEPGSSDELNRACANAANVLARHAATAEALLHAVEKFQGAVEAEDALYALKQARAVAKYARLAADQIPETAAAAERFYNAIVTIPEDLAAACALVAEIQGRVQPDGTGFNSAELAALEGVGLDPALYPVVAQLILDEPVSDDPVGDLAAATAAISDGAPASVAALQDLASAADDEVAELLSLITPAFPIAGAGGPYIGDVGVLISFDATGTTDPDTPLGSLTFTWDMDGDGEFDDATGSTPAFTYARPFDGLVGVFVEDPEGNSDVAYARITVLAINSPPDVAQDPPPLTLRGSPGTQFDFYVSVDDVDGDPTTVTWWLNDDVVETGMSYSYLSTVADIGLNRVRAWVSDGQPSTPDGLAEWIVMVAEMPVIGVSGEVLDFGVVLVGFQVSRTIDVHNDGSVDLEVINLALAGPDSADFMIVPPPDPFGIPPDGTAQIEVRFQPSSEGAKSASVEFDTNDIGKPHISVALSGVGTTMGDSEGDGDVDLADFAALVDCLSAPGTEYPGPTCSVFDFDADTDVDLDDFAGFQMAFTG